MKKKLLLLFSLVLCMALLAGCGKTSDHDESIPDKLSEDTKTTTNAYFQDWLTANQADLAKDELLYSKEKRAQLQDWADLKSRLGELTSQSEPSFDYDFEEEKITSKINAEFEGGKITFTMTYDLVRAQGSYYFNASEPVINENQSMSDIMSEALMNTLMGMGTVFCVLILISLVISSFGLIGKSQAKKAEAKKAAEAAKAPVQTSVMAPAPEAEEEVDDLELVAVITAAIMASMGDEAPAEGLVVRSIKKRNASSWKNA